MHFRWTQPKLERGPWSPCKDAEVHACTYQTKLRALFWISRRGPNADYMRTPGLMRRTALGGRAAWRSLCRANEPHPESVKKHASDGQKAAIMRALVPCAAYVLRWRVRSECNFIVPSGALAARGITHGNRVEYILKLCYRQAIDID